MDHRKICELVIRTISKTLPKSRYSYMQVYNGKSIEILSKDESEYTRIYLRVIYINNRFALDIANISLDERIQRHGIFTKIVSDLKRSRSLSEIWVSSVLTPEMHSACKKNNMIYSEPIEGYKFIIR